MHNRVWRAGLVSWAVCCGIGLVAGCEDPTRQIDQQVQATIDQARAAKPAAAQALYDKAAANVNASPIQQAIALEASARNHWQTAVDLIDQINRGRVEANRLTSDIARLVNNIRGEQTVVDAWTAADPGREKTRLAADKQSAIGSATVAVWYKHDQDPIPTLAKAQADIARLSAAINDNKAQQQGLQKQHDDMIAAADQLERRSEGETGQASVDDFNKASDLRKQAAGVSVQVDSAQAALVPLTENLGIAQAQVQIVEQAIANMDSISAGLDLSWTELQSKVRDAQQRISDYDKGDAPSVNSLAADLVKQVNDLAEQRKAAEEHLQKANTQLNMATARATMARNAITLPTDPSVPLMPAVAAAKNRVDKNSPELYEVEQSDCQRLLGDLHAAEAADLANRQSVITTATPVFRKARLTLPDGLKDSLDTQYKAEVAAAEAAYTQADQTLDKPSGATTPRDMADMKNVAMEHRIYLQVDWAALKPDVEAGHLAKAKDAFNRLPASAQKDVTPYLPAVIAPESAVAPASGTPAGTPLTPPAGIPPAGGAGSGATMTADQAIAAVHNTFQKLPQDLGVLSDAEKTQLAAIEKTADDQLKADPSKISDQSFSQSMIAQVRGALSAEHQKAFDGLVAKDAEQVALIKNGNKLVLLNAPIVLGARNGKFPSDLGSVLDDSMAPELFLTVDSKTKPPAEWKTMDAKAKAQWVNANTDFVYLGSDPSLKPGNLSVLGYIKPEASSGGNVFMLSDGRVLSESADDSAAIIAELKAGKNPPPSLKTNLVAPAGI